MPEEKFIELYGLLSQRKAGKLSCIAGNKKN